MIINIFIQARMSSSRYPGKVLAPFYSKPLIKHIVDRARQIKSINKIVVLTSYEESDDPLVSYLEKIKCDYFRGSLDDVFYRFRAALEFYPCDYFVRLSADSPFLNSTLVENMLIEVPIQNYDIISNVINRTFPKGHSVEIAKTQTFLEINKSELSKDDSEHVFPYFYRNRDAFKMYSVKNSEDQSHMNLCVDTLQDLERLSKNCEL